MYSSFDPEENTPSLRSDANDVQNLLQSRSQSPETAPQIIDARSKVAAALLLSCCVVLHPLCNVRH